VLAAYLLATAATALAVAAVFEAFSLLAQL